MPTVVMLFRYCLREGNLPCAEFLLNKGAKASGRPAASTIYQVRFASPRSAACSPIYTVHTSCCHQALKHRHEFITFNHGPSPPPSPPRPTARHADAFRRQTLGRSPRQKRARPQRRPLLIKCNPLPHIRLPLPVMPLQTLAMRSSSSCHWAYHPPGRSTARGRMFSPRQILESTVYFARFCNKRNTSHFPC
jgi:hypothetical protein